MSARDYAGRLAVRSTGMVCALGLNAPASCAAVRARLTRFEQSLFHDRAGKRIVAASAPEAAEGRQGYARVVALLARAVGECAAGAGAGSGGLPSVLVAVGEADRPDYPREVGPRVLRDLSATLGRPLGPNSAAFVEGPTGFFRALARAAEILAAGAPACVVAGADSLVNGRALEWLQEQGRLKTEFNPDGIIPGEAAAAVWLTRAGPDVAAQLLVVGLGFGHEASVLEEDAPNLAVGLADAMREALADAAMPLHEVDFRVGNMTGERLVFMEASTALARVQRVHKDNFELWVPAECVGDAGAALPACMTVLAATGFARGTAPGKRAILWASGRTPDRAAAIVVSPEAAWPDAAGTGAGKSAGVVADAGARGGYRGS